MAVVLGVGVTHCKSAHTGGQSARAHHQDRMGSGEPGKV